MKKLQASEINLENYQEVYEYFVDFDPSKILVGATARGLRMAYNPEVTLAKDKREEIDEHVEQGRPLIFASNHLRIDDQFVIGAAIQAIPILRKARERGVFVPAKLDYFNGGRLTTITKPFTEKLGGVPVFRAKDATNKALFRHATEAFLEMSAQKISHGQSMIIFPEGTRNRGDAHKILALKQGVAKIALRSYCLGVSPLIVPTAVSYEHALFGLRGPAVLFGEPITIDGDETPAQITGQLHRNLQFSVDELAAA